MAEERFSLKDHLFNEEKVSYLGGLLSRGVTGFDRRRFESEVMAEMLDLELKQRIAHISSVLEDHLDDRFEHAARQIEASLPPPLDPTLSDDDFGDFIIAPFGKFVEEKGIENFEVSMDLIRELTMRFSMEGTVRPFINRYPDETFERMAIWVEDDNYHVRRLVSEGSRPILPWSPRIVTVIDRPLPLLDRLHSDPTRYVTRSVANHLNDISKTHPEMVIESLDRWRQVGRQDSGELDWMTRHSLRTLIKQGHPGALSHLGYSPTPHVSGAVAIETEVVDAGESLVFSVVLDAAADEKLIVDYSIDFVKKSGDTKRKVFKLKQLDMTSGESQTISKRHRLRADATTYKLYSGTHGLTVMANGKPLGSGSFEVRL